MFYVYLLRRPDKEDPLEPGRACPFYVGKGSNGRLLGHLKEARSLLHKAGRKSFKVNIIHHLWAAGIDYESEIIWAGGSEKQAFFFECQVIGDYGRSNNGTGILSNFTDGGEGPSGIIVSQDTRKKLSELTSKKNKGNTYCLGRKLSEETRKKIGQGNKGRSASLETRKKMSKALKGKNNPNFGKHHSEESRKKMSEAQRGEKNHNFGKSPSEETLVKRSISLKGKSPWSKGKKLSEEVKLKMSLAMKGIKKGRPWSEARRAACKPKPNLTIIQVT